MKNNIPKNLYNASGIYEIRNILNDKVYVGSTANFSQRQRSHKCDLIKHKQSNGRLMNAYFKYGIDAFEFSVIEVLKRQEGETRKDFYARLLVAEYIHIERLGANKRDTGYNLRIDPTSNFGITLAPRPETVGQPAPNMSIGSRHHAATLNEQTVIDVKLLNAQGVASPVIAATLGVKARQVREIVRGETWRHVEVTLSEIESYVPPNCSKTHKYRFSIDQLKQIKYLLSLGHERSSIARFYEQPFGTLKGILKRKDFQRVDLAANDIDEYKSSVLPTFEKSLSDYKAQLSATISRSSRGRTSKLTSAQVLAIKADLLTGKSTKRIAAPYGISEDTVRRIARGDIWSHLTGIKATDFQRRNAKIKPKDREIILSAISQGHPVSSLARRYNVTVQAIYYIQKTS